MTGQKVTLTRRDLIFAAMAGADRHIEAVWAGREDQHGFDGDGWGIHIEGVCGEIAVAKVLDVFWAPSVNTFTAPDIGSRIQVRTRSRHDYDLIVRPKDSSDDLFVLVTGKAPEFWVRGWLYGSDAKREEWQQTHGNRPTAYFIPAHALKPIELIRNASESYE